ncbi:MAG: hypothetical protein ACOCXT_04185 [Candidatus Dojkabacteria bacterium]
MGLSVSRVGGNAQIKAMKQVAGPLKLNLAQFRELQAFSQFGVEVDKSTQKKIDSGLRLTEILKQDQYSGLPVEEQIVALWGVTRGYADSTDNKHMRAWRDEYLTFMKDFYPDILKKIREEQTITDDIEKTLQDITQSFEFHLAE